MIRSMIEQHQAYGDLMDRVSNAIRDRNEDVLLLLTDEGDRVVHDMQDVWSDVLARVEASPLEPDRDAEIGRLAQSVEQSLDKVRTAEKELAQWGIELGASLSTVGQGRNALRGYAMGTGR